ncbi:hypothetical protein DEU56DRAFT_749347, partial [Suillus clintonianus]|uniref:uncharacterized protein n=1 Tax=Suillus clintonianus TaxID=1904413 RepID=UPI001B87472C
FTAVLYFFEAHLESGQPPVALAVVSVYGPPDPALLESSSFTVWSCEYHGEGALAVIPVRCIKAVVAMVPHSLRGQNQYFVVEKPG